MARLSWMLAVLSAFLALASATSAPIFCKCTCFSNSTIIPLSPNRKGDAPPPPNGGDANDTNPARLAKRLYEKQQAANVQGDDPFDVASLGRRSMSASCSQCNRAFCLNYYNLPICKDAEEKDVVTMCFQRDSRKDQIIVWCFILGTTGLLGWAAAKHLMEKREEAANNASAQGLSSSSAAAAAAWRNTPILGGNVASGRGSGPGGGVVVSPVCSTASRLRSQADEVAAAATTTSSDLDSGRYVPLGRDSGE